MMPSPTVVFHRLSAYSREDKTGITYNLEALAADFIALAKTAGIPEAEFFSRLKSIWPEVEIEVRFPKEDLN